MENPDGFLRASPQLGMTDEPAIPPGGRAWRQQVRPGLVALVLVAATLLLYWPVGRCGFVYDDLTFILGEPRLKQGVGLAGISWAFTAVHAANWYPLTLISHLLDVQLFGLLPRGPHLVNLLLHAANTLLLFLVLRGTTGATARSGLVAALFAVHPLHVESVAWVSERKDVLSALFWLLAMLAYACYARRPRLPRYLLVCLFLSLGLLSKPMVVTLPFALLLFDFWPLGRVNPRRCLPESAPSGLRAAGLLRLALEKLPLLALAAASGIVTFLAQRHGGAVASMAQYPLPLRLGNAVVAYGRYLLKTVWPGALEVFYPYPLHGVPAWQILLAGSALAVLSAACVRAARRAPYLFTGWFWFVGTLVPVIGLVQVGSQAMADRYTYVPHIGLFVAVVWGASALAGRGPGRRMIAAAVAVVVVMALSVVARQQLAVWTTNKALFAHAVRIDPGNWVAQTELGLILAEEGKIGEGIRHYAAALLANPGSAYAHFNLGVALGTLGRDAEAETHYRQALALPPALAEAHHNLGVILLRRGRTGEALSHFSAAVNTKPELADAHFALGTIFLDQGSAGAAVDHFRRAALLRPGNAEYRNSLERALTGF
jgi:Flp pilus assembly protein TadD